MYRVNPGLVYFVEFCIIRYGRGTKLYVGGGEDVGPMVAGRDEAALDCERESFFSETVDHGFRSQCVSKMVIEGNGADHGQDDLHSRAPLVAE